MSPGFDIRPAGHRRTPSQPHSTTLPSLSTFPSNSDDAERPLLHERHSSEADGELGAGQLLARRRRERRGFSISGALYVGRRTTSEVDSAPSSPLLPAAEEEVSPTPPVPKRMGRRYGGSVGA